MRQQIAATRIELARDIDRLADQTTPRRLARRLKGSLQSLQERVMGRPESTASTLAGATDRLQGAGAAVGERLTKVGDAAADAMHGVTDNLHEAQRRVSRATQGSPIGIGLIAFGGGLVAAALIPETAVERKAAQELSEHAGPVVAPLRKATSAVVADVRETVESAAEQVRVAAAGGASHVQAAAAEKLAEVESTASDRMSEIQSAALGNPEEVRRQD